ncbi:hypothetical protein SODALDRAFT_268173, partial [Sodiomyces alkalinus F11]
EAYPNSPRDIFIFLASWLCGFLRRYKIIYWRITKQATKPLADLLLAIISFLSFIQRN